MTEPSLTLYKLMILYMLDRVDFPLSGSQLGEFVISRGYTGYFHFQQALNELEEDSFISGEPLRNSTNYSLTETGKEALTKPPDWLVNVRALREWNRITGELLKLDIIGNLDVDALGGYCNALAAYIETTQALRDAPMVIEKDQKNGTVLMELNPLFEAQRKHSDEMRKWGRLCGITLDSRLKAASIKVSEQESELEKEFGVI